MIAYLSSAGECLNLSCWHIGYGHASYKYRVHEAHKSIVGRCSVAELF